MVTVVKNEYGSYTVDGVLWVRPSLLFTRKHFMEVEQTKLVCAEIGVQRGDNASTILRVLTPKMLYLVDCWEDKIYEYPAHPELDGYKSAREDYLTSSANFTYVLDRYKNDSNVTIIKESSLTMLPKF